MADKDFDPSAGDGEEEVRPEEGSEAQVSDPARQGGENSAGGGEDAAAREEDTAGGGEDAAAGEEDTAGGDEWTVDDILGTEQNIDAAAEDAKLADLESVLLNDLKRLQAEYANYRRRTEEQREREIERAKGEAAKGILPVLDDLDRAAKHGDLVEGSPFAQIGEKVRSVAERLGVTAYGEAGEAFDPQHHEAIFQAPTPGVDAPTVLEVVEVGYRVGSVELRPAKVVVAVPVD